VWAPALSYANGRFWLVYSDVKCHSGPFKDVRNYLITAEHIGGGWSDPVYLNRSGFDPSLFHDEDGRKWLVSQVWKTALDRGAFAGILLQEFSEAEARLIGEPVNIFRGTSIGLTEGPHLYRKDGYYYLVTAEGGTEWEHATTVARSRSLTGPYKVCPHNPLLTSSGNPGHPLQKAGHGSFVQSPGGNWYLAHLCSRPVGQPRRCVLGRETALQAVTWPQGEWPRLSGGGRAPAVSIELPGVPAKPYLTEYLDEFSGPALNLHWNTLREPADDSWLTLTERPGCLRLYGRNSLQSCFDQSLVGFRVLHRKCTVAARIEFSPRSFQQRAGLAMYYNTSNFYYACLTANERGQTELQILACDNRRCREILPTPMPLPSAATFELRATLDFERLQFSLADPDGMDQPVGPVLDASILSDDYPNEGAVGLAFTGLFAALCAQDSSDLRVPADFKRFRYRADE
jgi:xylan 1,4-beta-xylosidase